MKVTSESKRSSDFSGLMWWTAKNQLDGEMKRRLLISDKPRSSSHESNNDRIHDSTKRQDQGKIQIMPPEEKE